MLRDELSDLAAFVAVAEARSFTRAATQLETSQSALSHTIRRLETRLGIRLLTRTTRRVICTEAGEKLLATLRPAFDTIEAGLEGLSEFRDRPAGKVRLTATQHAAETYIWPAIERLLLQYPDIQIELSIDPGLRDIVLDRFDAGVRFGKDVEHDMIAMRISPDLRVVYVGSPSYLEVHPVPKTPDDLAHHVCINLRQVTRGGFHPWTFRKDGKLIQVRVDGPLIVNDVPMALRAACAGVGLAFMMEDRARPFIERGELVPVLEEYCLPFSGYHLFYPNRRQLTPAFSLVLEALRHRG